ncbi:MAG TPA: ketol-acid reductoisomerase, partial [Candidatus Latescibacteria bacterium]|nr:ketol-acid reductoisomerase [Candidatus Latescibacterota bacterium]
MAVMYYDKDANVEVLRKKKIAVIGYGSQGHAQSQNLRDGGFDVVVAELPGTPNYEKALQDGWEPVSASEAAELADIVHILVPDDVQPKVYRDEIAQHMKPGKALAFSHGFNIHYRQIIPPEDV